MTVTTKGLQAQSDSPIFIGGLERSGKTYMRFMLAAHPGIAVSRRTNMWTNIYGRFGNLSQTANFERCLEFMMRQKLIRALQPDWNRIRQDFAAGQPTYGRLFAIFHEHYAAGLGKERWGDQTGLVERRAPAIFAAFPDARMIQLIRDPRDRFEAMVAREPGYRKRLGQATAKWGYSMALARENEERFTGRFKLIKYESLVANPEQTMRAICQFIGEEFVPQMLHFSNLPRFAQTRQTGQPTTLTTAYIGSYHKILTRLEISFIEHHLAGSMSELGYEIDNLSLTASEKQFAFLKSWAWHNPQMMAWRLLHSARTRVSIRKSHEKPIVIQPGVSQEGSQF